MSKAHIRWFLFLWLFATAQLLVALPKWATTMGSDTPYPPRLYYTGFGMARRAGDDATALETAKSQAAADLSASVVVHLKSKLFTITTDDGRRFTQEATAVSESSSSMELVGIEFDIERNFLNYYALARASKNALANHYAKRLEQAYSEINSLHAEATRLEQKKSYDAAYQRYLSVLPALESFFFDYPVYSVVTGNSVLPSIGGITGGQVDELLDLRTEIRSKIAALENRKPDNLDEALETIVKHFEAEQLPKGSYQFVNLTYQDTDFSSQFGAFVAGKLESLLVPVIYGSQSGGIIRGTYWERGESIELHIIARRQNGTVVGSSQVQFPLSSVPPTISIKPRNFEQAMVDARVVAEGAIVDGSINVEVWTNKGKNEDRLVFFEGEEVQFYFRVNQPAFLQMTDVLVTGDKVLLEESFYIGIDKVNMVVRYPYKFEPVPPLGVERVIITAYETPAPTPNVVLIEIEGHEYPVFEDFNELYSRTRGLRRKTDDKRQENVGEAVLTITTAPALSSRY